MRDSAGASFIASLGKISISRLLSVLSLLAYDGNILRLLAFIFGRFRKLFGNVRVDPGRFQGFSCKFQKVVVNFRKANKNVVSSMSMK